MVTGERWLFHARLSSSLNLWLLDPLDACRAVADAYAGGGVPLQSAEGFIRQVLGWREYIWGTYWLRGDAWRSDNALGAERPLPDAFWTGDTDAECLRTTLQDVRETGYAHHIQRLMVLGNLMLLLGVRPWEAVEWFQASFIDGAEWVMAPNTAGMATFADGGAMMTKPYAGGGNYIDRMSTYCGDCVPRAALLPGHRALLGLHGPPPRPVRLQPADADAAAHPRADGPGPPRGAPGARAGLAARPGRDRIVRARRGRPLPAAHQPPGVPPLALTGERTLPDVPEENYWFQRHLVVYEWIAARIGGRRVVDLACGEGYGSAVLARTAASVVGVDANPEAFEHARLKYTASPA